MISSIHFARVLRVISILLIFLPSSCPAHSILPCGDAYRIDAGSCSAQLSQGRFDYFNRNSIHAELSYELSSLQLGRELLTFNSAPSARVKSESLEYHYGDVLVEGYKCMRGGIEQFWLIRNRPSTPGPIVVEGNIHTHHIGRGSSSGIEFIDSNGRTVLRYGAVTVIDAIGRKYNCLPQFLNGRLRISLPAEYVASAVFPILIDPVVGPQVAVSPTFGLASGVQANVEIAASPYGYLAVWQDNRSMKDSDIFGCRLDKEGQVIDVFAIAISTATGDQADPAVTWDGQQYVVVWSDKRETNQHIYGARVRPDGELLDKQGILLSGANGIQAYAKVESDGATSLAVWQDSRSTSNDIYGCKIGQDGLVGRVYPIAALSDNEETPDLAWNGSTFTVVWCDYRNMASSGSDIYACRVSKSGVKMGQEFIVSCNSNLLVGAPGAQRAPCIVFSGSSCFVAWEDFRNDSSFSDLYCARINNSGIVLDTAGIAVCKMAGDQELTSIGYDGSKCLVVWRNGLGRLPEASRVMVNGNVLDANPIVLSSASAGSGGTAVAGRNGEFFVAWNNLAVMASDVIGVRVSDAGSVQPPGPTAISLAHDDQPDFAVADTGSHYVVVWAQKVDGLYDILGMLVSYSGELLLDEPVNITSKFAGDQIQPAIAWNGSRCLLVWRGNENATSSGYDISGLILDANLALVTAKPIPVSTAPLDQSRPSVASNGSNFFVAWEDLQYSVSPSYYSDISGVAVSANGVVAGSTANLCMASKNQYVPRVASNGTDYLVVWEDCRSDTSAIHGIRVTSAGALLGDNTEIKLPVTTSSQTAPDVCFGGGNYFVVWSDGNRISGCRIGPTGSLLDSGGLTICTSSKEKKAPSICWDTSAFRIAWEDYRSSMFGNSDIFCTSVSREGVVSTDSAGALISSLSPQYKPLIRFRGKSGVLFYSDYINYSHNVSLAVLTDQDVQLIDNISQVKTLATGTPINLSGKTVTAAYTGYFYIEEPDRSSGIRVVSDSPVGIGQVVDVSGIVELYDGERRINSNLLVSIAAEGEIPRPLGIRGDLLGGGSLNDMTPGITGGTGLNNIGLLVTTWGKVMSIGSDYFIVESKPGVRIKVKSGSLIKPVVGKFVNLTGISSCEISSGAISRLLLLREQNDIVTVN